MLINLDFTDQREARAMKDAFCAAIERLGDEPDFVYLDADLMSAIGTKKWAGNHPDKAFNAGVSEANMMGVAAGLSAAGLRPLVHTFGPFASRRCFDQVFLSIGYAKNEVMVIGSDPGVTAAFNGGTHMPFEDVALYRAIPQATIVDFTDSVMLDNLLPRLWRHPGLKYARFGRKEAIGVYGAGSDFEIGRAAILRPGTDVAIMACGIMVAEALRAANRLSAEGISAAVLDLFTIKPLDVASVTEWAGRTGAVVTAENHNVIGGLGSAVADALVRSHPCPVEMVGVHEQFGEVGPLDYLQERFALTADEIVGKVHAVLARK